MQRILDIIFFTKWSVFRKGATIFTMNQIFFCDSYYLVFGTSRNVKNTSTLKCKMNLYLHWWIQLPRATPIAINFPPPKVFSPALEDMTKIDVSWNESIVRRIEQKTNYYVNLPHSTFLLSACQFFLSEMKFRA